jgi:hypothetical protein
MTQEQKHTALPYRAGALNPMTGVVVISHPYENPEFTTTGGKGLKNLADCYNENATADAEFIVRACNSHYELLEALKAILEDCTFEKRSGVSRNVNEYRAVAKAAISKAEGK